MRQLYGNAEYVEERHRHRYEVNPELIADFEKAGMMFVGKVKWIKIANFRLHSLPIILISRFY